LGERHAPGGGGKWEDLRACARAERRPAEKGGGQGKVLREEIASELQRSRASSARKVHRQSRGRLVAGAEQSLTLKGSGVRVTGPRGDRADKWGEEVTEGSMNEKRPQRMRLGKRTALPAGWTREEHPSICVTARRGITSSTKKKEKDIERREVAD